MTLAMRRHATRPSDRLPARLGSVNQEVIPVGAWVEPEIIHTESMEDAVHNAQIEQQRLEKEQKEKVERLKRFQEEVKKRVQALNRAKKLQALEKSFKAVEVERNVVRQTTNAAERITPRRNRCTVRQTKDLSIRHSSCFNTQGGIIDPHEDESNQFVEQTEQVHKVIRQARGKLVSRKLVTEHYLHDDLPGGTWRAGSVSEPRSRTRNEGSENDENEDADLESKIVRFDREPSPEDTRQRRIAKKSAVEILGTQIERYPAIPNIYPGVQCEEDRIQTQNQRAMYRRLFMDIEREQVKENLRRRQHRKKVNQIKQSAERERQAIEEEALKLIEPKDPVTGQTEAQSFRTKIAEQVKQQQQIVERIRQTQRHKESTRFLEALKRNLQEKISKLNIDLPALCCCASTIWDTNPDTCANNCIFYRNHKAFASALQSLLASVDVM